MTPTNPADTARAAFAPFAVAMRNGVDAAGPAAFAALLAPDAQVRAPHPFGDLAGAGAAWAALYQPLLAAFPDLERREFIRMAGQDQDGASWVGSAGHYLGTFARPWLDIAPTGHVASLRFHEYHRFDGDLVVEVQIGWDIPDLMRQAGVWPMAPALGCEMMVPGPATQDGLLAAPSDPALAAQSRDIVLRMLTAMTRHPREPAEAMQLPQFWHPRMMWYGPAGIGTARGIAGFRAWHQIPFLAAMPDRGQNPEGTSHHFFADRSYVAVTGWPDMAQTLSHPGWLGLPPTGQRITLKSLDFWRIEHGLIRENWVLIDLLDVYAQIGADPLARMRAFNKARRGFDPETGVALP